MKSWDVILAWQCFFTFMLTGVIWCLQAFVYPALSWIDIDRFQEFEKKYEKRMVWIKTPLMSLECLFAILLLRVAPSGAFNVISFILFGILLLIWLSTFCFQMPEHAALLKEFNEKRLKKLIFTNWIRTIGWTLRSLLLMWLLMRP